jgi:NADPH:quinone reductase-like Zn-dependent oxidoreductase
MFKRVDLIKTGNFKANDGLITSNVEIPSPTAEEVLIDIKASAVNPVDWKMAEYGFFLPSGIISADNPVALGCDVAGVVVEPKSSPLWGKRVVTYLGADKTNYANNRGAFAERVVADASLVFEIPDGMSFVDASTMPVGGLTAQLLLDAIEPSSKPGDYVLVWGASSSVGYFAVQLAAKAGYKVIAVASGQHKDLCLELGAAHFIDYKAQDVKQAVGEIASSISGAVDCIGSEATTSMCADILAVEANNGPKTVSSTSGYSPKNLPDQVQVVGINLGGAVDDRPEFIKKSFPKLLNLKTQPTHIISGPVDATTLEKGFQLSKNGVSGEKIVIEWTK